MTAGVLRRPRRAASALLLLAALAALAACGGGEVPDALAAAAEPSTTSSSVTTSSTLATTTTPPPQPVTFAFAGDVHFEGVLRGQLADDPDGLLAPIAPVLDQADLAVANLETAVTERGTAVDKDYTFRAPATAYRSLLAAGVDVVNLANNHGMDFGEQGLVDTRYSAAVEGMPLVGVGDDATQAYAPYEATVNGQRVGIIGATQVLDGDLIEAWTAADGQPGLASAYDVDRLVAVVAEARPRLDTLVVFLHWGTEGESCPSERQEELADELVAAGADIVVGSHTHRLQGAGRLGDALVAYGLGNFAFYSPDGSPGAETGVLLVTATGRTIDGYEWVPAAMRSGVPTPLEGEQASEAETSWDELRDCTNLAP